MDTVRLAWAGTDGDRAHRREVAWELLRRLLAQAGSPDAELSNSCARCGGPHGAVQVTGAPWRASVSYAGALAVVAIHPGAEVPFGIDAEPVADAVRGAAGGAPGGLLRWVRAEAALKADGRGLRVDPALVEIAKAEGGWTAVAPGIREPFRGRELDGPPGVLVSAATGAAAAPDRRATP